MGHPWWPVFDLRLTTAELTLRPLREADLDGLAAILPDDVEQDPAATRFDGVPDPVNRGIVQFQSYWRAYGTWRVDSWRLPFAVFHDGELVGTQTLEGDDFVRLREVDSASFLATGMRGRGFGKQMRQAVLALSFDALGAERAITSAWHDNGASLGVSRALGYAPNGESRHVRGDRVDRMVHLALSREAWVASGLGSGVGIEGFEACRPLFGLEGQVDS